MKDPDPTLDEICNEVRKNIETLAPNEIGASGKMRNARTGFGSQWLGALGGWVILGGLLICASIWHASHPADFFFPVYPMVDEAGTEYWPDEDRADE